MIEILRSKILKIVDQYINTIAEFTVRDTDPRTYVFAYVTGHGDFSSVRTFLRQYICNIKSLYCRLSL